MTVDIEKPQPSARRGRLAFLRTKRAIAVLTGLAIVSVVLIGEYEQFCHYYTLPFPQPFCIS